MSIINVIIDIFRSADQSESRGISVPPSEYSTMSVASRIRKMPIPDKGADVDKFLDEVFQQVKIVIRLN